MHLYSNTVLEHYKKKVEQNSSIIVAVIIFKLYACNFGAFKCISPPSARYLNRIKCFGVERLINFPSVESFELDAVKYDNA
jgi:hypothetical protein